jgi:hypothetical protein
MRKVANERPNKDSGKAFYETQMTEAVRLLIRNNGTSIFSAVRHLRCYRSFTAVLHVHRNPIVPLRPSTVLPSVSLALIIPVLTWLSFSPGCVIHPAGERCHYITKRLLRSLAKWKPDAETSYKQDTAVFEGLQVLQTVEENVVRMCPTYSL